MTQSTAKTEIAEIRRLLRRHVPGVSVRMGRGTAYGWVDITGSAEWDAFTPEQDAALARCGLRGGGNIEVIAPADRRRVIERLRAL